MKLLPAILTLSILGIVSPAAGAGQQGFGIGGWQKAIPAPHAQAEESPIMLAAAPSPITTDAASAPVTATTQKVKYDAVYSMCGALHSADQVAVYIARDNLISPAGAIDSYFTSRGIRPNFMTGRGEPETILVKTLKSPEHGKLVTRNARGITFTYHANPGYLGPDQMIFEVETMGKKFKVVETVVVHNSGDLDYPTDAAIEEFERVCPSKKGSSLDIIELPADGFASDEELAKLHGLRIAQGAMTYTS